MKFIKVKGLLAFLFLIAFLCSAKAQKVDSNYVKTIKERAWKIVQKLEISKEKKALIVSDIIAHQYMALNDVYIIRDQKSKTLKEINGISKEEKDKQLELLKVWTSKETNTLHQAFIKQLNKSLTTEQVIAIKDGMTYGVVPLTYNAYQQMLPKLTEQQKKQIYDWLVEARELAMDAESSEKKHAFFGKYKGKINNYLSAAGIDMKKAGEEWAIRIKEKPSN